MISYKDELTNICSKFENIIIDIEDDELNKDSILEALCNLCDEMNDFRFKLEDSIQDLLDNIDSLEQICNFTMEDYL